MDPPVDNNAPLRKYANDAPDKIVLLFNKEPWTSLEETHAIQENCEYNNCLMTTNRSYLASASGILFNLCHSNMGMSPPISTEVRNPDQACVSM
ncbi:hypothetical protein DPMN_096818 [Dreissena polymorpha]|uniref:Uncharacterized protein n=1 Tax=Dreissena polymorpha TaxID=45954 RepID=A0A9D4R404_DREPO|nr:hypothetical protein DPMN_096818 [Dreissena polymorpha]